MGVAHAFLALTAAVLLLSYIKFCLEYPFVRVEHIRHVLPLIPLFAALAGKRAPGGRGGGLRCGVEFALDVCASGLRIADFLKNSPAGPEKSRGPAGDSFSPSPLYTPSKRLSSRFKNISRQ